TAQTESAVHRLLHRRMTAKQQMRWSPRGAHFMLKVRTSVMNGTFEQDHIALAQSMDLPCKSGEPSPMKDSGGGDEQEQTKTIYERVQTGGGAADADQRTQRRAGCK